MRVSRNAVGMINGCGCDGQQKKCSLQHSWAVPNDLTSPKFFFVFFFAFFFADFDLLVTLLICSDA